MIFGESSTTTDLEDAIVVPKLHLVWRRVVRASRWSSRRSVVGHASVVFDRGQFRYRGACLSRLPLHGHRGGRRYMVFTVCGGHTM